MAKSAKKALLLVALQTAQGAAATPSGATDAMLMRNLTSTPISVEMVERALIRPFMGNSGQIATTEYAQIEGEVELAGSGEAGVTPAWGPLLRACGFSETVELDQVVYEPVSGDFESLTLHYFLDGIFHKITDAKGTVTFNISAKGIPFMSFRFMGTYHPLVDQQPPQPISYEKFVTPLGVNKRNTPEWSLDTYSGCLESLTADIANNLVWRSLIGCEGSEIVDRAPTGQISLELPAITDLDWPEIVRKATTKKLSITHGREEGNIVELVIPSAQLTEPSYGESDGVAMLNLNLNLQPGAGNDEIKIIVR